MSLSLVIKKAHIHAYDRKAPSGIVHVKEHEDKRQAARMTTADVFAGLDAHVAGIHAALTAMGESQSPTQAVQPEPVPAQSQRTPSPPKAPPKAPVQPAPPPDLRPPQVLTMALMRLSNGGSLRDIMSEFIHLPLPQQLIVDHWLTISGHAVKDMPGSTATRFRAVVEELMGKVKDQEEQKPIPEHIQPQTAPGDHVAAAAKQRESETKKFTSVIDSTPEGATFIIPVATDKELVGTWTHVTIAGDKFWQKGNIYKISAEFQQYQDSVIKQLAEEKAKPTPHKPADSEKKAEAAKPEPKAAKKTGEDYTASPSEPGQKYSVSKVVAKMDTQTEGQIDLQKVRAVLEKESSAFVEKDVPIEGLKGLHDTDVDPTRVQSDKGAIIVAADGTIIDGRHRAAAAQGRGEKTIRALVPIKKSFAASWAGRVRLVLRKAAEIIGIN